MPPDGNRPVTMVLNLLRDDPARDAVLVAETTDSGVSAWLPRKPITIYGAQGGSRTIRVTMPMWLAREKNLATDVPEGQGSLF